jgi:hypothetical protein
MARRYPPEIERSIADAVIRGDRTGPILRGIQDGSLPGLSRPYDMPQRSYYDMLARVRRRLQAGLSPPDNDDTFLRELDEELAAEAASRVEAPEPPAPDKPEPPPSENREDRIARVVREIEALAAEHEESEQRERDELVERFRRELDRPKTIPMREALDRQRRLDPPAPRRELPRDPAGYMPLRPSKRPHPSNR